MYYNIYVLEPPGIPFEFSMEMVWSRSVRLGWRSPSGPIPLGFMFQYTQHNHLTQTYWDKALTLNFTKYVF